MFSASFSQLNDSKVTISYCCYCLFFVFEEDQLHHGWCLDLVMNYLWQFASSHLIFFLIKNTVETRINHSQRFCRDEKVGTGFGGHWCSQVVTIFLQEWHLKFSLPIINLSFRYPKSWSSVLLKLCHLHQAFPLCIAIEGKNCFS